MYVCDICKSSINKEITFLEMYKDKKMNDLLDSFEQIDRCHNCTIELYQELSNRYKSKKSELLWKTYIERCQ